MSNVNKFSNRIIVTFVPKGGKVIPAEGKETEALADGYDVKQIKETDKVYIYDSKEGVYRETKFKRKDLKEYMGQGKMNRLPLKKFFLEEFGMRYMEGKAYAKVSYDLGDLNAAGLVDDASGMAKLLENEKAVEVLKGNPKLVEAIVTLRKNSLINDSGEILYLLDHQEAMKALSENPEIAQVLKRFREEFPSRNINFVVKVLESGNAMEDLLKNPKLVDGLETLKYCGLLKNQRDVFSVLSNNMAVKALSEDLTLVNELETLMNSAFRKSMHIDRVLESSEALKALSENWGFAKDLVTLQKKGVVKDWSETLKLFKNEKVLKALTKNKHLTTLCSSLSNPSIAMIEQLIAIPGWERALGKLSNDFHLLQEEGEEEFFYKRITYFVPENPSEREKLKEKKLFSNEDLKLWNKMPSWKEAFEGEAWSGGETLTEADWQQLQKIAFESLDRVYPEGSARDKATEKGGIYEALENLFALSMSGSSTINQTKERDEIRKWIATVMTFLIKESKKEKPGENKALLEFLELVRTGTEGCIDRMMVYLEKIEMYIKLNMAGEEYLADILVNIWKKLLIEATLGDPTHEENLETSFFYLSKLSGPMGLGLPPEAKMVFGTLAKTKPWFEVLLLLGREINVKNLVGFVSGYEAFRSRNPLPKYILAPKGDKLEVGEKAKLLQEIETLEKKLELAKKLKDTEAEKKMGHRDSAVKAVEVLQGACEALEKKLEEKGEKGVVSKERFMELLKGSDWDRVILTERQADSENKENQFEAEIYKAAKGRMDVLLNKTEIGVKDIYQKIDLSEKDRAAIKNGERTEAAVTMGIARGRQDLFSALEVRKYGLTTMRFETEKDLSEQIEAKKKVLEEKKEKYEGKGVVLEPEQEEEWFGQYHKAMREYEKAQDEFYEGLAREMLRVGGFLERNEDYKESEIKEIKEGKQEE